MYSHACWDDSYDDYYDYDDYDDDWLYDDYDDWFFDDYDWNYDDDEDIVYGEIDEDKYDIDGGELYDGPVVTPDEDYDWGLDDDWWRTDYGDDDDYGNDDDWYDDYEDSDDVIKVGYGSDSQDKDSETDPKDRKYLVQDCKLCCVPAVMAIMNMYSKNISIEQAEKLQELYKDKFHEMTGKYVSDIGVSSDRIEEFMKSCGFVINHCSVAGISICTDAGYQVFVFIDVIEDGKRYGHALDIIDTNKDNNGNAISYECINPYTGNVETYNADEFKHPQNIYCVKEINECK